MTLPAPALDSLGALLGDRLATSPSILGLHARDESRFAPREPDAVAGVQAEDRRRGREAVAEQRAEAVERWGGKGHAASPTR